MMSFFNDIWSNSQGNHFTDILFIDGFLFNSQDNRFSENNVFQSSSAENIIAH